MGILMREADGKEVPLCAEHVVGRIASCSQHLPAPFVSLAHALIRWTGTQWEMRDLGSTNGTCVDGLRVPPGEFARLSVGSKLIFGDVRESWTLVSDLGPLPAAVPLDGGEPRFLASGAIALPGPAEPLAAIYPDGERWVLECEDAKRTIVSGEQFAVAGRVWRFECSSAAALTWASREHPLKLADLDLVFSVSSDEEHVSLALRSTTQAIALGERTIFYLALVLARQRLADKGSGLKEHGWVAVSRLLRMVPDYASDAALNVDVFRFRRILADAGVSDSVHGIERRRGEVRLGTERVVVVSCAERVALHAEAL